VPPGLRQTSSRRPLLAELFPPRWYGGYVIFRSPSHNSAGFVKRLLDQFSPLQVYSNSLSSAINGNSVGDLNTNQQTEERTGQVIKIDCSLSSLVINVSGNFVAVLHTNQPKRVA